MIRQLKPYKDSFYTFVYSGVKRFDALILCEGRTDAEVIKELIRKLGIGGKKSLAITDCEGINKLYDVAAVIALLFRIFRKVKVLAVIIDADRFGVKERLDSLTNSLSSKGLEVSQAEALLSQVFRLSLQNTAITTYVAINAVRQYHFKKHELEDHILKLLELEGRISKDDVVSTTTAKEYLSSRGYDVIEVVRTSAKENVSKALNHIVTLLMHVMNDP